MRSMRADRVLISGTSKLRRAFLRSRLEQGLGEGFTPDVREAWTVVFVLVSDTMKAAARAA